jgi:hypothetical protein
MRDVRIVIALCWAIGSASGLMLVAGCSDDRLKTGTQVQVSEQQKAQDDQMKDMYKEKNQKKP